MTKEIKPVNLKGDQPWIFTGRTDNEAEAPIFQSPVVKSWLIRKDPVAGKDWRQKKKVTEDEMVGWHHQCNGHELGQTLGDSEGQGGLVCCKKSMSCRVRHNLAMEQQERRIFIIPSFFILFYLFLNPCLKEKKSS